MRTRRSAPWQIFYKNPIVHRLHGGLLALPENIERAAKAADKHSVFVDNMHQAGVMPPSPLH